MSGGTLARRAQIKARIELIREELDELLRELGAPEVAPPQRRAQLKAQLQLITGDDAAGGRKQRTALMVVAE